MDSMVTKGSQWWSDNHADLLVVRNTLAMIERPSIREYWMLSVNSCSQEDMVFLAGAEDLIDQLIKKMFMKGSIL